jgi:hypothetical protein
MEMSNFAHRRRTAPSGANPTNGPLPLERFAEQLPLYSDPDETPGPDGIRWGLVNRIRSEIALGIYEDEEKLAAAVGTMIDHVR